MRLLPCSICLIFLLLSAEARADSKSWQSVVSNNKRDLQDTSVTEVVRSFDATSLCLSEEINTVTAKSITVYYPDTTFRKNGDGDWVQYPTRLEEFTRKYEHAISLVAIEKSFLAEKVKILESEITRAAEVRNFKPIGGLTDELQALLEFMRDDSDNERTLSFGNNTYVCRGDVILQSVYSGDSYRITTTNTEIDEFPFARTHLEQVAIQGARRVGNPEGGKDVKGKPSMGMRVVESDIGWRVIVTQVGGLAERIGLQAGDVVTHLDGISLKEIGRDSISDTIGKLVESGASTVTIDRDGRKEKIKILQVP